MVELKPGDTVPAALIVERDGGRFLDQRGNGACAALDPATMLCTIYESRPQTCRDFHRGGSLCRWILDLAAPKPAKPASALAPLRAPERYPRAAGR